MMLGPAVYTAGSPTDGIRPETELLLCCARTCMDSERAERIRALVREDIDWQYLIRMALTQGVMPLLHWHLNATCPEAVPKETFDQLRDHFHINAFNNLFLSGELLKLLNLFELHGIPAIPYKGPALAASAYGSLSLRQFCDLDILLHKQDILTAKELLISQGYQLPLTSAEQEFFLKHRYHFHFVRDDGRVHVELHWAFTRRYWSFPTDLERLWERLEPASFGGGRVLSFHPEDLLLILCVHGAKHYWQRLGWICDIAELIRVQQRMNWGGIIEQAVRLRSQRLLFLGLFLASDLLGAALPAEVLKQIQADQAVKLLAAQVQKQLFSAADGLSREIDTHAFYLRIRECMQDRVPYFLHSLRQDLHTAITPTARDRALLPLPPSLFFLYYVFRPIRLVKEYRLSQLRPLLKHLRG